MKTDSYSLNGGSTANFDYKKRIENKNANPKEKIIHIFPLFQCKASTFFVSIMHIWLDHRSEK